MAKKPVENDEEEIIEDEEEEAAPAKVKTRVVYRDRPERDTRPLASESAVAGVYERLGRIEKSLERNPFFGKAKEENPPEEEDGKAKRPKGKAKVEEKDADSPSILDWLFGKPEAEEKE